MEIMAVMYLVLAVMLGVLILVFVLVVAGKDIYIAFKRWFNRKGCDVYIANPTRKISHYYLTAKEGVFRIANIPYVTNPDKVMNLTEEERQKVTEAILQRQRRLEEKIEILKNQKQTLEKEYKDSKTPEEQKYFLKSGIAKLEMDIQDFNNKIRIKEENYFKDKRPAFFYIENDPVPKDFHEFWSTVDAKMIDNMVTRSISQAPGKESDKQAKTLKLIALGAAALAAAAAVLAFQNNSAIIQICKATGATC